MSKSQDQKAMNDESKNQLALACRIISGLYDVAGWWKGKAII